MNSAGSKTWIAIVVLAVAALGAAGYVLMPGDPGSGENVAVTRAGPEPGSAESVALGKQVYAENCLTCHGGYLEGQPNWQSRNEFGRLPAPPQNETGHTWHHPDQVLLKIVKFGPAAMAGGGYESDMPAFEDVLTDEEIFQALDFIKSNWPDQIKQQQLRRTERANNGG